MRHPYFEYMSIEDKGQSRATVRHQKEQVADAATHFILADNMLPQRCNRWRGCSFAISYKSNNPVSDKNTQAGKILLLGIWKSKRIKVLVKMGVKLRNPLPLLDLLLYYTLSRHGSVTFAKSGNICAFHMIYA